MTDTKNKTEQTDNRSVFLALLADAGLTQAKAAELISGYTNRPCSVRTVRSWLNNPDSPSSRNCPEWAVRALREAINNRHREG